jgi:hypothetical protein
VTSAGSSDVQSAVSRLYRSLSLLAEADSMTRITLYDVRRDVFNEFLDNPSRAILERDTEDIVAISYPELISDSYVWSAHRLHVNSKLIAFAGSPQALESFLTENGIVATVKDSALLFTRIHIPVAIWVNTDGGDYFIAIKEIPPAPRSEPIFVRDSANEWYEHSYTLFCQADFCDQYRIPIETPAENLTLIVLGNDITEGHYVGLNYEYRYAELPFFAVLEAVGATIKWDSPVTAFVTLEGIEYYMNVALGTLIDLEDSTDILFPGFGSEHKMYYEITDGELIIDSDTMNNVLFDCKIVTRVDYITGVISLVRIEQ